MNTVRQKRQLAGLTQVALAERAGCDQRTVSGIETGEITPSLPMAQRLAAALDSTVDELFPAPAPAAATKEVA